MNEEISSGIRNKLTAPQVVLERMANGEQVPREVADRAPSGFEKGQRATGERQYSIRMALVFI